MTANSGPGLALSALLASSLLPAASAAREPTEQEQFMVELINRARLDPAAEVAYFGLGSLNEGPPTLGGVPYTIQGGPHQAVAVNPGIVDATSDYAELMEANDTFCHTCLGTDPQDRMFAAGYVSALSDFDPPGGVASYTLDYGYADGGGAGIFLPGRENLAKRTEGPKNGMIDDLTAAVAEAHAGLFEDLTVPSRGHRSTMMYGEWKEVGVGIAEGPEGSFDSLYISIDFAHRSDTGPFLTGVAYDDVDGDDFYTPDAGEPLGGLLVQAFGAGTATLVDSTNTFASGGYSLELPVGTYDVHFSGPGIDETFPDVVLEAGLEGHAENTKLDFVYAVEPAAALSCATALGAAAALGRARRRRASVTQGSGFPPP